MQDIFCGLEKLSLVDFDNKVCCTVFTKGCNFACPFCHNSHLLCDYPTMDTEEIFAYLEKRKSLLDAVCITGGEPTLHKELPELIKRIKDLGYLVKLDSNGTNPKMLKYLIENNLVDYIAMDIKSSEQGYDDICACHVNMENVKESIAILLENHINFEFRTTLINEYHNEEIIKEMAKLIKGARRIYLQKFVLRDSVPNQTLTPVSLEDALKFKQILEDSGLEVILREYDK